MDIEWDLVARLLVAAGLGALIGFEREVSDQPAGLRTHLAVCLGAALFGVISTTGFLEFETTQRATNIQFDVTRVASLVASGIGFIGAGLIFREGDRVRTLTTAASLWVTSAIGLSCGVGDFSPAVAAAAIMLVALAVLRLPRAWVRRFVRVDREEVRIRLARGADDASVVRALHELDGVVVDHLGLEKDGGAYLLVGRVHAPRGGPVLRGTLSQLARRDDVESLRIGGGVP
jgi:uncharacterized membrane protein YhiD involved in acid resistance